MTSSLRTALSSKEELEKYLIENFYTTDFINDHTRPQLVKMLKLVYPDTNWKRGMCKERQIRHIENWINENNIDCDKNQMAYDYRTTTPFEFASKYYG